MLSPDWPSAAQWENVTPWADMAPKQGKLWQMGLSAVAPFQVEGISRERPVSHTCCVSGLEERRSADLLSESRLPEDQQQNCLEEEKRMTQQEVTRSKVTGQGKVMGGVKWKRCAGTEKQEYLDQQQARG